LAYRVDYKSSVVRDLRHPDTSLAERIIDEIEQVLACDPEIREVLTGEFKGLNIFRVGEYRIIYAKTPSSILILRIGHRKSVYR
jgi:mRNA-degrading endonuclease RelE of RelBE toxin-antitoxin system